MWCVGDRAVELNSWAVVLRFSCQNWIIQSIFSVTLGVAAHDTHNKIPRSTIKPCEYLASLCWLNVISCISREFGDFITSYRTMPYYRTIYVTLENAFTIAMNIRRAFSYHFAVWEKSTITYSYCSIDNATPNEKSGTATGKRSRNAWSCWSVCNTVPSICYFSSPTRSRLTKQAFFQS